MSSRYSGTDAVRTSRDVTVFDESCAYPIDATQFYTSTTGAGSVAHNAAQSLYVVGVGTSGGDRALLRSHARPRASARQSRTVVIVGSASGNNASCVKRFGAFTDTDGWYFELTADVLACVRRSSVTGTVVSTPISRPAWTVESQRASAFDPSVDHVYEIRDVWPSGDAEFYVDGELVHTMPANARIRTARLPVSIEVVNTGSTIGAGAFSLSSPTVLVDDEPRPDRSFAVESSATGFATAAAALAVRPLATVASQPNSVDLRPASLTLTTDAACLVQLVVGGTVAGTFATPSGSLAESCAAPSGITGGRVVASYRVASTLAVSDVDAILGGARVLADGTVETLAIVVTSASGSPVTVRAALVWMETR